MPKPAKMIAPPIPTTTPITVALVLEDMPESEDEELEFSVAGVVVFEIVVEVEEDTEVITLPLTVRTLVTRTTLTDVLSDVVYTVLVSEVLELELVVVALVDEPVPGAAEVVEAVVAATGVEESEVCATGVVEESATTGVVDALVEATVGVADGAVVSTSLADVDGIGVAAVDTTLADVDALVAEVDEPAASTAVSVLVSWRPKTLASNHPAWTRARQRARSDKIWRGRENMLMLCVEVDGREENCLLRLRVQGFV